MPWIGRYLSARRGLLSVGVASTAAIMLALLASSPREVAGSATYSIDQGNRDWALGMKTADADLAVRAYAEDAVFVMPDGQAVSGKAAIRGLYAHRLALSGPALEAEAHSDGRAAIDADDLYEWGEAWLVVRVDGSTQRRGGRFLTVWRRYPGTGWKITRNLAL